MQQRATRVNPSEEIIKIGPVEIRSLLTGDDSNGSVSVFEVHVPVGQKLAAPAHKNDAYEEILYGIEALRRNLCLVRWAVSTCPGATWAKCARTAAISRVPPPGTRPRRRGAPIHPLQFQDPVDQLRP
jgi:hypothetical protein